MSEYALTPEQLAEIQALQQPQPRPSKRLQKAKPDTFVQLPYEKGLEVARFRDASMAVLIELAHLKFTTHQNTVTLANARLGSIGVSPDAKTRALRHLEAAGIVAVDWRGPGRSPRVTLLWKTAMA
jgi:hypothetical protein